MKDEIDLSNDLADAFGYSVHKRIKERFDTLPGSVLMTSTPNHSHTLRPLRTSSEEVPHHIDVGSMREGILGELYNFKLKHNKPDNSLLQDFE